MTPTNSVTLRRFWLIVLLISSIGLQETAAYSGESGVARGKSEERPKVPFVGSLVASLRHGGYRLLETVLHPMEFREPVVSMPAEGRYGLSFYGKSGLNPFAFDPKLIAYDPDTVDIIETAAWTGRFGSYIEFEGLQTNLSYLLFKKSYFDLLTGFGFRYGSVFPLPTTRISDKIQLSGPPEVPGSWGVTKTFTPAAMEGNVVTSLIMQWHPKWFLHFKYSYGLNRVRFYRDDSINPVPYGTGTTSAYSVGIKFIRKSETAARYAWGFELRHIYTKVDRIHGETPISGFQLPSVGVYFSFGAFYGGNPTIGDQGKKLFLKRDYVSARRKFKQFLEQYPHHARVRRARKFIEICNARIPHQLYAEGLRLEERKKLGQALERYVEAERTADTFLRRTLRREIDAIAQYYVALADSLFELGEEQEALSYARQAAAVSEIGKKALPLLEGRIAMRQGEDLAAGGVYSRALEKYSAALKMAPSLRYKIRRLELETAVGMLEDVNKAHDEASLRLALQSLYRAREILGKSDDEMEKIIAGLEEQLTAWDEFRVKQKVDEYMAEAREGIARRHMPRVQLGMLVAEVEDILGKPDEVVDRVDEKNRDYQLWIYNLPEKRKRLLYFEDYVLFKMEEK